MKIQELINQTHLDLTPTQIKAFFLGMLSSESPMPFKPALQELLSDSPEVLETVKDEFKKLWDELQKNHPAELQNLFSKDEDLSVAQTKLDYFLTAMSLAGTDTETDDEDLSELLDELEDMVMDMDEYLSQENPNPNEGKEILTVLLETWQDFIRVHKE